MVMMPTCATDQVNIRNEILRFLGHAAKIGRVAEQTKKPLNSLQVVREKEAHLVLHVT